MSSKTASIAIGIIFLAVGLLGFASNPIISTSEHALFHMDSLHNYVHVITGLLFLIIGFAVPNFAPAFLKIFGAVYLLLGIMGLVMFGTAETGKLLGFLHVNGADNFLHIGLGLIILLAGFLKPKQVVTM